MDSLNLNMKTDFEILNELIAKYNNTNDLSEKLNILNDIEYYVHQVILILFFNSQSLVFLSQDFKYRIFF